MTNWRASSPQAKRVLTGRTGAGLLRGAVAALLMAGPCGPALSQDVGAGAAQDQETALARQHANTLQMALGVCFEPPAEMAGETVVTIGFDLDNEGRLVGLPELLGVPDVTADVRRLYLAGAMALDKCAPYPPDGTGARYEADFSRGAVQSIRRIPGPEDADAPVNRQAAVAVHRPATEETEMALALDRDKRREVQRRLQLLEFEPGDVDGVFGQNTRDALSAWQQDKGFPVSGYLSAVQLLALNAQSQEEYAAFLAARPKPAREKQRVQVCRPIGLLGLRQCRWEYR